MTICTICGLSRNNRPAWPGDQCRCKRYAIYPGRVLSANDSDEHFISAPRLMALYGVHPRECVIVRDPASETAAKHQGLIELRPRRDGCYDLPEGL